MKRQKAIVYFCLLLLLVQTCTLGYARNSVAAAAGEDQPAEHRILQMVPSKARFAPGEPAELILTLNQSADWGGKLHVQIYKLNTLIAEGVKDLTVLKDGSAELKVDWTPPADDFTGYLAKAWTEGAVSGDYVTAAIDVSSDWTHFPRYGYVADFPKETAAESDAKLKQLSREYYLNGYQFYDWMWRHDVSVYSKMDASGKPLKDKDGNFITEPVNADSSYTDLLGRLLFPLTVKQSVSAAQKYGSAAMAYEMNYAAREHYEDFGVKPEWGLYNKTSVAPRTPEKDQVGFYFDGVKPNPTALYLQDPGNPEWRSYITKQYVRAVNDFGFDGIHLDQWGTNDKDYLLGYDGTPRYFALDFDKIINSTKDALLANDKNKSHVAFNMVGGNQGYSAVPNPDTKTDFDYSEIWQDKDKYKDLQEVVDQTREADGGKAMVIAGYMNYKQATGIHYDGSEAKDVPSTVVFQSRIGKAASWVGDFGRKDEDQIVFTVDAPEDSDYNLTLRYGHGNDGGSPEGYLTVNGEPAADSIVFDQKTGWGHPTAEAKVTGIKLHKGRNEVKLQLSSDNLWLNVGSLLVENGSGYSKQYDAIFSELISCKVDQYGNVYYFETDGDYVTFHVNVPADGDYPLGISYSVDSAAVNRELYVNGAKSPDVSFSPTGGWDSFKEIPAGTVHLKAGDNTITLKSASNDPGMKLQYLNLDGQRVMAENADIGWQPTRETEIEKVASELTEPVEILVNDSARVAFTGEVKVSSPSDNEKARTDSHNAGSTVTFKADSDKKKKAALRVYYHSGNNVELKTTVSNAVYDVLGTYSTTLPENGWYDENNSNQWGFVDQEIQLDAGVNFIKLELTDPLDYLNLHGIRLSEASESAGAGYIRSFKQQGDYVAFKLPSVPASGSSPVSITYKNGGADTVERILYVDGKKAGLFQFAPTGENWGTATEDVFLSSGSGNEAEVKKDSAALEETGIEMDNIRVNGTTLEAEDAETGWAPVVSRTGSVDTSFGKTDDFGQKGQSVTFTVNPDQAVSDFSILYRSGNDSVVSVSVDGNVVDGSCALPVTQADWGGPLKAKTVKAPLTAGSHEIKVEMQSSGQYTNLSSLLVDEVNYAVANAVTAGGVKASAGYVSGFAEDGDFVAFNVKAPAEGSYTLDWNYKNTDSAVERAVSVNGAEAEEVPFPKTEGETWTAARQNGVHLNQGLNSIKIAVSQLDDRGIVLDSLKVASDNSDFTRTLEAENADFLAPMVLYKDTVLNFGHPSDAVSFDINVPQSGETSLIYTYSNAGTGTSRAVYIDGVRASDLGGNPGRIYFDPTSDINTYSQDGYFIVPHLDAGKHTVTLKVDEKSGTGSVNIKGLTLGYFNEPSLRLMDAGLAALGATHIEIGAAENFADGPSMLAHEYYPNKSKKMLDSTKEAMKEYYKFNAAYENLLFDSKVDPAASLTVEAGGSSLPTSGSGARDAIWTTVRKNASNEGFERYDVLHLINLLNNDDNWRNAANEPSQLSNLKVTYDIGMSQEEAPNLKVYAATPDAGHGVSQELKYTRDGDKLIIELPSLKYWTMIYVDKAPKSVAVQPLFGTEPGEKPSQAPSPSVAPSQSPSPSPSPSATPAPVGAPASSPSPSPSASPAAMELKKEDLEQAANGKVMIALDEAKYSRVAIPAAIADGLKDKSLVVQGKGFALEVEYATLAQLLEENKGDLTTGAQIVLSFHKIEAKDAALPGTKPWAAAGSVYDLQLGFAKANGEVAKLSSFKSPMQLSLNVDGQGYPAELLGIYYYNEVLKQWEYIGGKADGAGRMVSADLSHLSRYTVFAYDKSYTDVKESHWAYGAIRSLTAKHVINGLTDSTFAPSAKVTRAQYAAMLAKALHLRSGDPAPFRDVAAGAWYAPDIAAAYEAGIIAGRSADEFTPSAEITRQEMAVMLAKAFKRAGESLSANGQSLTFRDRGQIAAWALSSVQAADSAGLMDGQADGRFAPKAAATRAEAAQTIVNLLKQTDN
ncbi:glycoside hydrolase family 66 protein [Paenibacillus sabinae]|uniref:S-layer protein n=1 Tax=Paenibacillus sabinae T27 TaxID=1268072 RepID=X4ZUJ0_9BACL|nr:glycoside hydrolase family 66 protein [Paenibacillus sabinae]AHV95998.1 S-layer protein [Paenibacillus sabinae T27]